MAEQKGRVHSINWHIGDWTVKTRSLTPHARAALCMVWETMVARDGPFDYVAVDFAYSARMTDAEVTAAFDELQRKGLLKIDGRIVSADDCQREIDSAKKRMKVAADNGAKGGRPAEKTKPLKSNETEKPIANPQLTHSLATANPQLTDGFTTTNHNHEPQTTITNHDPQLKPKPAPRRRNTIPDDDWKPSDKLTAELKSKGWTQEQIDRQTRKRVDYCRANGKAYADHDAAFRNWMSGPFQNEKPGQQAPPQPPGRMTSFERECQRLDEWAASLEKQQPGTAMDEGGMIIDHEPTDHIGP